MVRKEETLMRKVEKSYGLMSTVYQMIGIAKVNVGFLLISAYIGANYAEPILRVQDYVLKHNSVPEAGFHADPRGLSIDVITNSKGKRESYLQHKESGTKMPLMYDMLPSSTHIISALEKRVSTMDKKERKEIGLYIARIYKKL